MGQKNIQAAGYSDGRTEVELKVLESAFMSRQMGNKTNFLKPKSVRW